MKGDPVLRNGGLSSCSRRVLSWNGIPINHPPRIVFAFCAPPVQLFSQIARDKENDWHPRLATPSHYSFPPLSTLLIVSLYDQVQSCPLYALAIPSPEVCPISHNKNTFTHLSESTRSDDGWTPTSRPQHRIAHAARLHLPYHP